MCNKFEIQGSRIFIRTEKEMLDINHKAANASFKKYKKIILDEYLKTQGFLEYKSKAYVKRNSIDVLEYIDLQNECHGSKTFTVNYALMPLYISFDYIVVRLGGRLGRLINGQDIWWDYAEDKAAEISFQNVSEAIGTFLLPWFEKYSDEKYLKKYLKKQRRRQILTRIRYQYENEDWLRAIEDRMNRSEIIYSNIQGLRLPKNL